MKHITRWSPDTCGCIYEYEWDDTELGDSKTHSLKKVVKLCHDHEHLGNAAYDAVVSENTRKNNVVGMACKLEASVKPDNCAWFFDGVRALHVIIPPLSSANKTKLQTDCNTEFGNGKVVVE